MSVSESKSVLARRVGAAACAAWGVFGLGVVFLLLVGGFYLAFVHVDAIHQCVASVWGVEPMVARRVMIFFAAAMKFAMFLWLGGCLFLTFWARRLDRVEGGV